MNGDVAGAVESADLSAGAVKPSNETIEAEGDGFEENRGARNDAAEPEMVAAGLPRDSNGGRVYAALIHSGMQHMPAFRQACGLKNFEAFCVAKGLTLANAPADALTTYARSAWKPSGQNSSAHAVLSALDAARQIGIDAAPQSYEPIRDYPRTPRKKKEGDNVDGAGLETVNGANGAQHDVSGAFDEAPNVSFRGKREPLFGSAGEAPPPQVREAPRTVVQPSARVQSVKNPLPQGARVRISKIATGYEGPGIAPGQPLGCGEFMVEDVSSEGAIQNWIARWMLPKYGPFAGHPDTTYRVEQIDNRGAVQATWQFAFAAPAAGGAQNGGVPGSMPQAPNGGSGGGGGYVPNGFTAPQPPQPQNAAEQRFIDYLMDQHRDQERKFAELEKSLRDQKTDPTVMMMLLQQNRPQPIPWEKVLSEMRRPQPSEYDLFGGGPQRGSSPAPAPDPAAQASANAVDGLVQMTQRAFDLARERPDPVPAPPQKDVLEHPVVRDLISAMVAKAQTPAADPFSHPLFQMMRDEVKDLRAQLVTSANKPTPSLMQQLNDLKALKELFSDFMGGGEPTIIEQVGGVIEAIAQNGDKLADLVGHFTGKALTLPKGGDKAKEKTAGAGSTQKPAVPFPDEAKEAILALRDAPEGEEGEQIIATGLQGLIVSLIKAGGEMWPTLAQSIIAGFTGADSKAELRSLVTSIFKRCGAKPLAADEKLIEKVAAVLHKHYSVIYNFLTKGQQKTLPDGTASSEAPAPNPAAPGSHAEPAAPAPAASAAQPAAGPEEDDDEGDEEDEADDEEQSKAANG